MRRAGGAGPKHRPAEENVPPDIHPMQAVEPHRAEYEYAPKLDRFQCACGGYDLQRNVQLWS